jgi:hypothetical protein
MKTTLIIGSGVSYYSDIPGINLITDTILNSKKIGKGTDTNYYLDGYLGYGRQPYLDSWVTKSQKLICLIKINIDNFYKHIDKEHTTNYEDIYYVLRQITDSYYYEYENPSILKLIEYLLEEMQINSKELKELADESTRFITCIAWQSIDKSNPTFNQFDIIKDLIGNCKLDTILTLNHDLVLDNWLLQNDIAFDDGFYITDKKKLQEWIGFKNDESKIKLCKLHGSIDWFNFRISSQRTYDNIVKIPRKVYAERVYSIDESFQFPINSRPEILIGTFNKMIGYLSGMFEIMYDELKSSILNSEIIIISGYGFGDKGINIRLTHWLWRSKAKKMIIIHPNKAELIKNSRGSFKINILNDHYIHDKVVFIENKFEDVDIDEIKKYFA